MMVSAKSVQKDGHVRWLTRDQARELFEREAQRYLKMSGAEFIRKWNAGEFDDDPDRPEVMSVAALLPLVE
jgi:hypothetical protein